MYPLHRNCEVRAMGKKSKLTHKPVSESRVLQRPMTWPACLCPKSPRQMEGHQHDKRRLGSLRLKISQDTDQAHSSRHLPGQGSTGIQRAPLPSKLDKYPNKATTAAWSSPAEALQLVSRSTMSYRQEMTGLGRAQDVFPSLDSRDGPQTKSHSSLTHTLAR